MGAGPASTPDEDSVPGVLLLLLALVALHQLVAVKFHGWKLERVARKLPTILEQRLGTEKSLLPSAELDEAILAVDHADDDSGVVGDHLDIATLLGDADEESGVLLVGELGLHALGGKVTLDKHC